jgi:hypothetical protein
MVEHPTDDLVQQFTGLVIESLAVRQDFGTATVGCRRCSEGSTTLSAGDRVSVALSCYGDYFWEIEGVYCPEHSVDSVAETMSIRAERQAVVDAVLESTGYHPPRGNFQPDALTLGDVTLLDFSPRADGYYTRGQR